MTQARALVLLVSGLLAGCSAAGGSADAAGPDTLIDATAPDPGAAPDDDAIDTPRADAGDDPAPDPGPADDATAEAPDAVEPAADVPVQEVPADVEIPLSVELHVEGTACDASNPGWPLYRVDLHWTASVAAGFELQVALNDFTWYALFAVPGGPATEATYSLEVSAFGFSAVPKVGDVVLARVHAFVTGTLQQGWSEPISVAVTPSVRACLYPYDPECSDNALIDCEGSVPTCAPPLVLAAFDGCFHCVYAATCTCDDGSLVTCEDPPPICSGDAILVPRGGCRVCVDPATCLPPG